MDPAEEWCTISRAVEIIVGELHISAGRAETRLIEACAAGNVRSRVKRLTAADCKSSIGGITLPWNRWWSISSEGPALFRPSSGRVQ
jgi:hypothetical protein